VSDGEVYNRTEAERAYTELIALYARTLT